MKVLSSVVIYCVVVICCDVVYSKTVTAIAKAQSKSGHGKNPVLLDQDLADKFQGLLDDFNANYFSGASKRKLAKLYDPIDVKIMMPNTPTLTDPIEIVTSLGGLISSFPAGMIIKGEIIEAYSYRFGGFRMANAICRNVGTDADGDIIYIARASQIWRRFGKKWKLHRENLSFECLGNCQK